MTAPTTAAPDLTDASALVGFGLQPRLRPLQYPRYRDLVQRCRLDRTFRTAVEAFADGLEMDLIEVHPVEGLVLHPRHGSLFTFRLMDHPTLKSDQRLVLGLAHVGIAARVYPFPADLEEDTVKRVSIDEVDGFLRHLVKRLQDATRDSDGLALPHAGLDAAWRCYAKLTPGRPTPTGRLSQASSQRWIRDALDWLVDQGMAYNAEKDLGAGHFRLAHRFRLQVREAAAGAAFALLSDIRRAQLVEKD
ncbi:hypothetical protein ACIQOW_18890 [Kitasatospora sp. NPDC091335]|uniref:hypothetical protein n=1 Tax=Kitasatospora sp. NPDC091335 TaxID=3364085 RepID=UPI0037FB7D68